MANTPTISSEDPIIDSKVIQLITADQAYHYRIIPLKSTEENLIFLTDKGEPQKVRELEILWNRKVRLEIINNSDLNRYLSKYYRKNQASFNNTLVFSQDILEKIIFTAKQLGSSDIHFEPFENSCRVRYRIDGKLKNYYAIDVKEYPIIINKVKIRASLDISEKRLPQDGRISINNGREEFDIRVSTLPTLNGEKMVLRLLSKDATNIALEKLGMTVAQQFEYTEVLKKPQGIILISGPTGSGKTTTLYATLKLLNNETSNILTIEDPIEYTLEGINQVQLKEAIGLNFSSALKTFLRQDPDIIMVGEIRDPDTANMAIRAALTGHLVLSTVHTNSAWATVSRLIDMGIPPFLLTATLNLSMAQRLVRKLCDGCKIEEPLEIDPKTKTGALLKGILTHFTPNGCDHCFHTGYNGRIAVYELLPITEPIHAQIHQNKTNIDSYLTENRIKTLRDQAIELLKTGRSSLEEIYPFLLT